MKKVFISLVIIAVSLCSCAGRERAPEEYVKAENFVIYTTPAASNTTPAVLSTDESTETTATNKRLSYALNGNVVELQLGGEEVNSLVLNYVPDKNYIAAGDFDFDGVDELYIPSDYNPLYGIYYYYDEAKHKLIEEDKLNELGRFVKIGSGETLIEEQKDGSDQRITEYQWFDGELKPIRRTDTYSSADGITHTDIYQYDENGYEYLAESK